MKEEDKPSTSDDKFDSMMKTMEKMMDRLSLGNASAPPAQHEPQFRNPQFRRPQNQQRPRENKNHPNPLVRPPFQQNLLDEEEAQPEF